MCLIVTQILAGDDTGTIALYKKVRNGPSYPYLLRNMRDNTAAEDATHDVFIIALKAIRSGALRNPEALTGYLKTLCKRSVAGFIDDAVKCRQRDDGDDTWAAAWVADYHGDPEYSLLQHEQDALIQAALESLSEQECQVLTRFYRYEQSKERIMDECGLSPTSFRLFKSRAKAKFAIAARKLFAKQSVVIPADALRS